MSFTRLGKRSDLTYLFTYIPTLINVVTVVTLVTVAAVETVGTVVTVVTVVTKNMTTTTVFTPKNSFLFKLLVHPFKKNIRKLYKNRTFFFKKKFFFIQQ